MGCIKILFLANITIFDSGEFSFQILISCYQIERRRYRNQNGLDTTVSNYVRFNQLRTNTTQVSD